MDTRTKALDLTRSGPWFAGLLLVALLAFWPTYLSKILDAKNTVYTHWHAVTATLWILMLIAQPWAIRNRRYALHRATGRASFVIAPLLVTGVLLAAHYRTNAASAEAYAQQTFVLYLQLSLAMVFSICYLLAIANRRRMPLHARFMVCTALTLIDPIVIRIMFWIDPTPDWHYWWFTFGLTDAVLLALIWFDRNAKDGRWVFPAMLPLFVVTQLPAVLKLTGAQVWQDFARWYASLPLT